MFFDPLYILVMIATLRAGARAMLRAAALTHLAAGVTAVLTLLYYFTLARRGS